MFVQVIEGRTRDPEAVRAQLERWAEDVRPGAIGFLGSTAGVADDGTVVVLARFADAASAEDNADRPEQGAWWEVAATCFDGEPAFRESSDTDTLFGGGSDDAGFVQVMKGVVPDRDALEGFETDEMMAQLRSARPDLLGGRRVWFDDGGYLEAAYFTSEDDARGGEQSESFEGPQQQYVDMFSELHFIDLRDPILI